MIPHDRITMSCVSVLPRCALTQEFSKLALNVVAAPRGQHAHR